MFKYVTKTSEKQREDILEINNKHHEEMMEFKEEMSKALNNNTIALTKLCEKLEVKGGENYEIK